MQGLAHELDPVDQRIVALLQEDGRASLARIADNVDLSPDAVRGRLARLTADGVVRVIGVVDPATLGYGALATLAIRFRGSLDRLVEELRKHPQVTFLALTIGAYQAVCEVAARDDRALSEFVHGVIGEIDGVQDLELWRFLGVDKWEVQGRPPPPTRARELALSLDEIDVQLLRALAKAPRLKYSELQKIVDQPYAVVRRRTQTLFDEGVIVATAVVDLVTAQPRVMALLGMQLSGDAEASLKLLGELREVHILMHVGGRLNLLAEVACASPEDLGQFIARVAALPGVRAVESLIMTHFSILPMPWAIATTSHAVLNGHAVGDSHGS